MIITIDGTSASGKTTVARELAKRLGFALLRTGAMYRALALAVHRAGLDQLVHPKQLEPHLAGWQIDADEGHVYLNGKDVSHEIDGNQMSNLSSSLAELPIVREHINRFIHHRADCYLAQGKSFVAEGRDQGSFVFPKADCKFYIDASVEVRAMRRLKDLHHAEDWSKTREQLAVELEQRDHRDRSRAFAPLCIPQGAMVIDSSQLSKDEVVEQLFMVVQACRGKQG